MAEIGHFALCLAWIFSLFGFCGGIYAGRTGNVAWIESARRAAILTSIFSTGSVALLAYAFAVNDYSLQYVWQFSNRDMQLIYKIAAVWGGMDGSMLLWAAILSISLGLVAATANKGSVKLMPWVLAVACSSTLFFLTIVVFATNPFRAINAPFIPPDGNGLNPLLQNPLMAIHPPMLYLGFTTFAIPFAFCLGALLAKQETAEWILLTRRWTLVAWLFLTVGIVLGGLWAYVELGWGGFWAWDPVENSSFFPWLTGTAFLHSVMVQERKGMLKLWNFWLVVLTYALTVFGTFLTRSGIVQSVHAFASTDIGWIFLLYLGLLLVAAAVLSWKNRVLLKPERQIQSIVSRESAFLVNNLLLLSICFATIWGVMFPVFSEAITGTKQAVGIPFFNEINVPLFLLLVLTMGIGPLLAWKQTTLAQLKRLFIVPAICGIIAGTTLLWAGVQGFYPILSYSICFFVVAGILAELHREKSIRRHHVRFGAHLVHFGVVIATIGITASMAHKIERDFTLATGEQMQIGRFTLELEKLREISTSNYDGLAADIKLSRASDGSLLKILTPELRRYRKNNETTTEVALRTGAKEDVYIVIAGLDDSGERAALKIFINPLQIWLWIGTLIIVIGTLIVMVPRKQEVTSEV